MKKFLILGILLSVVALIFAATMTVHTTSGEETFLLSEIMSITFDDPQQEIINVNNPNSSTTWIEFDTNTSCDWSNASGNTIYVEIYKGSVYKGIYHGETSNDGHCERGIPLDNWGTGTDFRLKVIDNEGNYGWSEYFTIEQSSNIEIQDEFTNWNSSIWSGNQWHLNNNQGSWQPNVDNGVAHMYLDDFSWGQIRTNNDYVANHVFSVRIIPYLNSGSTNGDRCVLALSSNWIQYNSPDAVGIAR